MKGKIFLKHAVKHAAGLAAVALSPLTVRAGQGACILMYHRVADTGIFDHSLDDWNISPTQLQKHFEWLSKHAECVPLGDALKPGYSGTRSKPVVALTFDDGFANFSQNALPC